MASWRRGQQVRPRRIISIPLIKALVSSSIQAFHSACRPRQVAQMKHIFLCEDVWLCGLWEKAIEPYAKQTLTLF